MSSSDERVEALAKVACVCRPYNPGPECEGPTETWLCQRPEGRDASDQTCARCGQHRSNGCLCHIPIVRSAEWRKGWNDGELAGREGVIRQIHEAVAHLDPPDTGMGVFELVEWALAAAIKREADR